MSGSTGCMVFLHDDQIISVNVGDSRAVLYSYSSSFTPKSDLRAFQISRDHTPELEDERKRILSAGGEIR